MNPILCLTKKEVSMNMDSKECSTCGCACHNFTGILIILFGLTFLLGALGVISAYAVSIIWPILLILVGIVVGFRKKICKCCSK